MDDPLRHHGDVEARGAELDLAVNVYDGPRPSWLDDALHASIDAAGERRPDRTSTPLNSRHRQV